MHYKAPPALASAAVHSQLNMKINTQTWSKVFGAKICTEDTMNAKGYTLIKELFVDSSGFGADNEPALTQSQFEREITATLTEHGPLFATITRAGQFQVYVGLFKKDTSAAKISRRVANNTLEINYPDGRRAYRLHNTDIVTYHQNGDITLNTDGWDTVTTRERMTRYLPPAISVVRRKGVSYVYDRRNDSSLPLCDGMRLIGYGV